MAHAFCHFSGSTSRLQEPQHQAVPAFAPSHPPSTIPPPIAGTPARQQDSSLDQAKALAAGGGIGDIEKLTLWLERDAGTSPALRTECCRALGAIAQRGGFVGEAGRPLQDALRRLNDLSRYDPDSTVQAQAAHAAKAIDAATDYLPAWTMSDTLARDPVTNASPVLSAGHAPPSGPCMPLHRQTGEWTAVQPNASPVLSAGDAPPSGPYVPLHLQTGEWSAVLAHTGSQSKAPPKRTWPSPESAVVNGGAAAAGAAPTAVKRPRGSGASELGVQACDHALYNALVTLRTSLSDGKPAYTVATNDVLALIASARPTDRGSLRAIKGIGPQKVEQFGDAFCECVRQNPAAPGQPADVPSSSPTVDPAASSPPADPDAKLSDEQLRALQAIDDEANIFLTGGAGTGKSFTLKKIIEFLHSKYDRSSVFITASTGIAACAIGGTTVHSWAGIGLGKESAVELADKVAGKMQVRKRWQHCRALVIDEISMLDGALFEKLDYIARHVRSARSLPTTHEPADEPFGGIQLVLCGDFFQLPPVGMEKDRSVRFLFETDAWHEANLHPVVLTKVFRQRESQFISLLDEMRRARLSPFSVAQLKHHARNPPVLFQPPPALAAAPAPLEVSGGGVPTAPPTPALVLSTRLFANNDAADAENGSRLDALTRGDGGRLLIWLSHDEGPPHQIKDCIAQHRLSLRVGAQVMLLKNLDQQAKLVNGSRGVVLGFEPPARPDGLKRIVMYPAGTPPMVPKVAFQVDPMAGAAGWLTRLVYPEEWSVEEGGRVVASRTQIPLKLAWAISIHKSQGMTIPTLEVELASCFEAGQAYVALSRAVSLQQTRILTFDERRVKANQKVCDFYADIEARHAEDALDPDALAEAAGDANGPAPPPLPPPPPPPPPALSEEQRARIEANKRAALARRMAAGAP